MTHQEKQQLAWEQFTKNTIVKFYPYTEIEFRNLFLAGYDYGFVDGYKEADTLEPLVIEPNTSSFPPKLI